MRRPNGVVEGVKPIEAVFDIVVPFSEAQRIAASLSGNNLRIPDASYNAFVCIAAYYLLQCNIRPWDHPCPGNKQKGRPNGGLGGIEKFPAYSAATFRGGSSAPESWISATS